jgi:hypothetical protein
LTAALAAGFAFVALVAVAFVLALALAWEAACAGAAAAGLLAAGAGAGLLELDAGPPDELGRSATVHTAKNAIVATRRPIRGRGRFAIKPLFGSLREDLSGLMFRQTGRPLLQFESLKNFFLKHRDAEPITRP